MSIKRANDVGEIRAKNKEQKWQKRKGN